MCPESAWGFTGFFARENGGGFLTEHYPEARKACWDFSGIWASSRHIPHVKFPGTMHPGLIGTLPSADLLNEWNKRETNLELDKTIIGILRNCKLMSNNIISGVIASVN